jgi:hypothetical protein
MKRLRKFVALTPADRKCLIQALGYVGTIRLGLLLLPFPRLLTLLRLFVRRSRPIVRDPGPLDVAVMERMIRWVPVAGRCLSATCLPQALTVHTFLVRRGWPVQLRIGVAHPAHDLFKAHAWVEYAGRVILGQMDELQDYLPIASIVAKGFRLSSDSASPHLGV